MAYKNCLEDPRYPLLGPNIKSLHAFGLLHSKSIVIRVPFALLHICSNLFVWSMFVDIYIMRENLAKVLFNIPLTVQSLVCISKTTSLVLYQKKWRKLFRDISSEELSQIFYKDKKTMRAMRKYRIYCRTVTYLYWSVIVLTTVVTILSPFVTHFTSNYTKGYPKIISSWFPFDVTKKPGYFVSVVTHVVMIVQGGGIIASYDTTVFVIMSFLKGHLIILKTKCTEIFGDETAVPRSEVLKNIKECHRLHNFLTEQYRMFNQLISPVMFIYVLICSVMICCCVVQLNLDGATVSEKFWILEYMIAAGIQLFIFCWHSNDITYEGLTRIWYHVHKSGDLMMGSSRNRGDSLKFVWKHMVILIFSEAFKSSLVDRGIFNSNWWRADPKLRTHLTLLSGKLAMIYRIRAGPFTSLSMPTFTEILRGAYSFYTLFTKSTNK